jgi:hypothetical protein
MNGMGKKDMMNKIITEPMAKHFFLPPARFPNPVNLVNPV